MRPPTMAPGSALTNNLGTSLFGQPAAVVVDHRGDVGGFAVDGDVAWPGQRRAGATRPGVDERLPVVVPSLRR